MALKGKYTLSIGEVNTTNYITDLCFENSVQITETYIENETEKERKYNVSLSYLKYHKRVYEPCEISATVKISAITGKVVNRDGTETTVYHLPKYDLVKSVFFQKKVQLAIAVSNNTAEIVAKNYLVFKMKPIYSKENIMVELSIYSFDKLMTLDKYSKAYTAKKLGIDIFPVEVKNFTPPIKIEGDTTSINLQFLPNHYESEKDEEGEDKKDAQGNIIYKYDELRIPYAVQYNESFYDFMVRMANRYGEFLFFEDGKLHLGLDIEQHVANYSTTKDWGKIAQEYYYESVLDQKIDVEDSYYPYLKRNSSVNCYATGNFNNSNPVPADEYLDVFDADDYASFKKEFWFYWQKNVISVVSKALTCSTLYDIILDIAWQEAWHAWNAENMVKNKDMLNSGNVKTWQSIPDQNEGGNKIAQFSTINGSDDLKNTMKDIFKQEINNLTSIFYSVVRKVEKEVGNNAVWMSFHNDYYALKLGDKINIGGKNHVVIQIDGECDGHGTDELNVVAIPLYKNGKSTQEQAMPPALPNVLIREAKPQSAFIMGNVDPEKLGRVRIKYPWQKSDGDASPWIRVALPMATYGGGVNFKPEISDEVMVDYEEGNIDRPYVVGYLQSKYCTEKWGALPDRGLMSKNGHSLTFNDPVDGSGFFANMLPVFGQLKSMLPAADWKLGLSDNEWVQLAGGVTLTDRYGLYRISGSSDGRMVNIASPLGNIILSAFTGITLSAPNGDITIAGKNVKIVAGNKVDIMSGSNITKKFFPIHGLKYKHNFWAEALISFSDKALANTVDKFLDIKFLRTVFEVFVRPVDGTTKIKSFTFLQLEAGTGATEIPLDAYGKVSHKSRLVYDKGDFICKKVAATFNCLTIINTYVDDMIVKLKKMYDAIAKYKAFVTSHQVLAAALPSFETIRNQALSDNGHTALTITFPETGAWAPYTAVEFDEEEPIQRNNESTSSFLSRKAKYEGKKLAHKIKEQHKVLRQERKIALWKNTITHAVNSVQSAMYKAYKQANKYRGRKRLYLKFNAPARLNIYYTELKNAINTDLHTDSELNALDVLVRQIQTHDASITINSTMPITTVPAINAIKKKLRRKAAYKLLGSIAGKNTKKTDFGAKFTFPNEATIANNVLNSDEIGDDVWIEYVNQLGIQNETPDLSAKAERNRMAKSAKLGQRYTDLLRGWGAHWRWSPEMKGKILLSDTAGKTIRFNSTQLVGEDNAIAVDDKYISELKRQILNI